MIEPPPELTPVCLKPGELLISRDPFEVTTVLGSCVAVTMFSHRLSLAAICHAMLPSPYPCHCGDQGLQAYKYVIHAVPDMIKAFRRAAINSEEIEVKMFGGANVLRQGEDWTASGIGHENVQLARRLLAQENLAIKASNVGGRLGRKIVFNTLTGQVFHKHL